jgi:dTDP-4-amino-4,6-dideoxygalactose transaminase
MDALEAQGVQTGIHYPVPVHLLPAYSDLNYQAGDFPIAERLASEELSLPMFPELAESQIDAVVSAIEEYSSVYQS